MTNTTQKTEQYLERLCNAIELSYLNEKPVSAIQRQMQMNIWSRYHQATWLKISGIREQLDKPKNSADYIDLGKLEEVIEE
tara:strand:- start:605 stop:847 length:243 start_codon:yes stop_codon:yes gene_type:complete